MKASNIQCKWQVFVENNRKVICVIKGLFS